RPSDNQAESFLRSKLRIPAPTKLDLWALPDPPAGEPPSHPYRVLNCLAIWGSPQRRLQLREIRQALMDRFDWYREHP
ncbi:hypothetical protein CONPUDRAFT_36475, partial [Coniophora puteana RWD-64-598 SS2]